MSEGLAAFFGAVIGSGLMLFRDWIAHAFITRRNARYLAIRIVTILDRFVDECASASIDDGYLEGHQEPTITTKRPSLMAFPNDLDWRSIDHQLAFDLLSLDNKTHNADQSINAAADMTFSPNEDEFFSERRLQYAILGLEAAELARIPRDTHDLPRRSFGDWNPINKFVETREEITKQRETWRAEASKWAQEMSE